VGVAREAGDRTRVAVRSHNPNVDAIGTIVGRGGANIKKITSKFHPAKYDAKSDRMVPVEENIDVIEWVADPAEFIYNAIAPAEVDQVIFNAEDNKRAIAFYEKMGFVFDGEEKVIDLGKAVKEKRLIYSKNSNS